jgi:hypothetical protein
MLIMRACFLYRYGLGTCYLRKSKIRMAEYHYRKAAEIHPNNAVLLGCVGMVRRRLSMRLTDYVALTMMVARL